MKSAMSFLIAAKRCEIRDLEQLALTCELVRCVGEFVHRLQSERGTSNVFLASRGTRFAAQRAARVAASLAVEGSVRERIASLGADPTGVAGGARLFGRLAYALQAIDALPELRGRVESQRTSPEDARRDYTALIAGLLAVVFEAADCAADAAVSRALVALFNLMQGKELAGQERALRAASFVDVRIDAACRQPLQELVERQERCFQIFVEFADPALQALWRDVERRPEAAEVERLRRAHRGMRRDDADVGERWFDCASGRIDAMRDVEERTTNALSQLCKGKIVQARAELQDHESLGAALATREPSPSGAMAVFVEDARGRFDPGHAGAELFGADALGSNVGRSVLDLVRGQTERLQALSDELDRARAALTERKLVERAKGLLMSSRGLTEDEAYRLLRETAMNQKRRLVDVAEATLALADFLRPN